MFMIDSLLIIDTYGLSNCLVQWFPNCEPRLPREPPVYFRGAANHYNFSQFYLLFIILFQFADVDIIQSILDIWFHMLICSAIMCCVYDSFGTGLHTNKGIDMSLKFFETAHPSALF